MLQHIVLNRTLSQHNCPKTIHYSVRDSPLECNSLIYCYDNNQHKIYKIIDISNENVTCYEQWHSIGVYKLGSLNTQQNLWGAFCQIWRKYKAFIWVLVAERGRGLVAR